MILVQAYHSSFNEEPDVRQVGNMSVLPIKTRIRGPAPVGVAFIQLYHIFQYPYHLDS